MRRAYLVAMSSLVLLAPLPSAAQDPEDTGAFGLAGAALATPQAKIRTIVAPLSTVPAIVEDGALLRIEIDGWPALPHLPPLPSPINFACVLEVYLTPSFTPLDREAARLDLDVESWEGPQASRLWEAGEARTVSVLNARVPTFAEEPRLREDLYDLTYRCGPPGDTQRRAVKVVDELEPPFRIAVIADPQTGDPRALNDGFADATGVNPLERQFAPHEPDPEPLNEAVAKTFGVDALHMRADPRDRWGAFRDVIREVNLLQPDFVLFSGDMNFMQDAPGKMHLEYEDTYAMINGLASYDGTVFEGIRAPTYLSPGNHDGYVADGEDGFAVWRAFFGPLHYSVDIGPLHLVSINTYDWSELDRAGLAYGVSAWGGQVRAEQFAWLEQDLCDATDARDGDGACHAALADPGKMVLTFAHHDPSWMQSDYFAADPTNHPQNPLGEGVTGLADGVPVAEQVTRGAVSFATTDQGWSGEGRLELRDLLRAYGVDAHFAGHTHRDRVARDVGNGDVAETSERERPEMDLQELHYVARDGALAPGFAQDALRDLLRAGTGPLYVDTTTAASDTKQYWGWRLVDLLAAESGAGDLPAGANGIWPFAFGYDATRAFLDARARVPGFWNETHAPLGLFSTPTHNETGALGLELGPFAVDGDSGDIHVTLSNRLDQDFDAVEVALMAPSGPNYVLQDGDAVVAPRLTRVGPNEGFVELRFDVESPRLTGKSLIVRPA